jgi:hypothetical protein
MVTSDKAEYRITDGPIIGTLLYVCLLFEVLTQLIDFKGIRNEFYGFGGYSSHATVINKVIRTFEEGALLAPW